MSAQKEDELKEELLRLMLVEVETEWGPGYKVCNWCRCSLGRGGAGTQYAEEHSPRCFAVVYLGRPARKP